MADETRYEAHRRHNGQRWVITPPGDGAQAWSGSGRPPSNTRPTTSARHPGRPKIKKGQR